MIENHRLLRLFSMPKKQTNPYTVAWIRDRDFFGDQFTLQATVDDSKIKFEYLHANGQAQASCVWSFSIAKSPTGRARIEYSNNIHPPLHTIERASAIIASIHHQLQANPVLIHSGEAKLPKP